MKRFVTLACLALVAVVMAAGMMIQTSSATEDCPGCQGKMWVFIDTMGVWKDTEDFPRCYRFAQDTCLWVFVAHGRVKGLVDGDYRVETGGPGSQTVQEALGCGGCEVASQDCAPQEITWYNNFQLLQIFHGWCLYECRHK